MKRFEVIMGGIGGQGLLVAGLILGQAAAIYEKKYAVQIESYAPLARGGSSSSELIISDEEIFYPRVGEADLLIALAGGAFDSYKDRVKENGLMLVNSDFVKDYEPDDRIVALPLSTIAKESTGKLFTVSMVALGAMTAISDVVEQESIYRAIMEKAPAGTGELNVSAAKAGFEAAKNRK